MGRKRMPAPMRTRQALKDLMEGRADPPDPPAALARLAARILMEENLEAEARDAVGRDYYEHGAEEGQGCRNGCRTGRLKTAEGEVEFSAPRIAGREEPFRSKLRAHSRGAPRHWRTWRSRCRRGGCRCATSRTCCAATTAASRCRGPRPRRSASGCGATAASSPPRI